MLRLPTALLLAIGLLAGPARLLAAEPVAIVEEISSVRGDLQVMDFLETGRTITLTAGETLTLGYLAGCRRETIIGGTVTIGQTESAVSGGTVSSETADCGGTTVAASTGSEAGAVVFRKGSDGRELPAPARILSILSPLVRTSAGEVLKIERLDKQEASRQLVLDKGVADLEKARIRLTRGGLYRLRAGEAEIVVEIDRQAKREAGSVLVRILTF